MQEGKEENNSILSFHMLLVPHNRRQKVILSITLPSAMGHATAVLNGLAKCNGKKNIMRFLADLILQLRIKSLSLQMSKLQSKTGTAFLHKCGLMDKGM